MELGKKVKHKTKKLDDISLMESVSFVMKDGVVYKQ